MEIKVSTESGSVPVTVMHVEGNIDSFTYQEFKTKADELLQGGVRFILVDLSQVPFVSSAGLRALHELFNQLRALSPDPNLNDEAVKKGIAAGTYKSPHLKMLNLSSETRTAFDLAGFNMFIETFKDMKTAIASF